MKEATAAALGSTASASMDSYTNLKSNVSAIFHGIREPGGTGNPFPVKKSELKSGDFIHICVGRCSNDTLMRVRAWHMLYRFHRVHYQPYVVEDLDPVDFNARFSSGDKVQPLCKFFKFSGECTLVDKCDFRHEFLDSGEEARAIKWREFRAAQAKVLSPLLFSSLLFSSLLFSSLLFSSLLFSSLLFSSLLFSSHLLSSCLLKVRTAEADEYYKERSEGAIDIRSPVLLHGDTKMKILKKKNREKSGTDEKVSHHIIISTQVQYYTKSYHGERDYHIISFCTNN